MSSDRIVLKIKEGGSENYFEGLKQTFGGEYTDNMYTYKKGSSMLKMFACPIMPDFEIIVTEAKFDHSLLQERLADDNPDRIHIYIVYRGHSTQHYDNQNQYIEAGTSSGIFIYNGLFPVETEYAAHVDYNFITLKLTKKAFAHLLPSTEKTLNSIFVENTPKAYHIALPIELEAVVKDIIYYESTEFERIPMVMAKGLELFTLLMQSVKRMSSKEDLHGLHKDDYQRMLQVKELLLSKINGTIVIDDIASEFGISSSKLKRDFKTLFSTSIYQFYTHAKMDEAYRRLKTGNYSVLEVGYDLGYSSIPNFSKMFKKVKGISPKEVIPI